MVTTQATVDIRQPRDAQRKVLCPLGCEYSATLGDYWNAPDAIAFTCNHDGDELPCSIVERVYVTGTDSKGRPFGASGWVTVVEDATVGDLRKL